MQIDLCGEVSFSKVVIESTERRVLAQDFCDVKSIGVVNEEQQMDV